MILKFILISLLVVAVLVGLNYLRRRLRGTQAGKIAGGAYKAAVQTTKKVMPK